MKLSDRVRPDVEAAPWVCEEIKVLENKQEELLVAAKAAYWYIHKPHVISEMLEKAIANVEGETS
jgi:hypothetical protein